MSVGNNTLSSATTLLGEKRASAGDLSALEERVDGAGESVAVALRQFVEGLQPPSEPAITSRAGALQLLETEQLVGRDLEDAGELDDELAVQAKQPALVVGDDGLGGVEHLRKLDLSDALRLAEAGEALAERLCVGCC